MKRVIDVKSLVIGVLATALFFTIVGAKSRNNANFDTITAKKIRIVNSEGKVVAKLSSIFGEGWLFIYNKEGKLVADSGSSKGEGMFEIYNKEGKLVTILGSSKNSDGGIYLYDKYGDLSWMQTGKK